MFSGEQLKIFHEYVVALKKFNTALMQGQEFQAAAWDIYCDELLKIINNNGWGELLRYYLWKDGNYDESSH